MTSPNALRMAANHWRNLAGAARDGRALLFLSQVRDEIVMAADFASKHSEMIANELDRLADELEANKAVG